MAEINSTTPYDERPDRVRGKTPAAEIEVQGRKFAFYYPSASESQRFFREGVQVLAPFLSSSAANIARLFAPIIAAMAADAVLLPEHDGEVKPQEESSFRDEPGFEDQKEQWEKEEEPARSDVGLNLEASLDNAMARGKRLVASGALKGAVFEVSALEQSGADLAKLFRDLKPAFVKELLKHVWMERELGDVVGWQNVGENFDAVFAGKDFLSHYLVVLMAMGAFWLPFDQGSVMGLLADLRKLRERFRGASSAMSSKQASTSKTPSSTPSSREDTATSTPSSTGSTGGSS